MQEFRGTDMYTYGAVVRVLWTNSQKIHPRENTRILRSFSCFPGPWPIFWIFEKIGANLHSTKGVILHGRAAFFQPPGFWTRWTLLSGRRSGGGSRGSPAWVGTPARLGRDRGVWSGKNIAQNQARKPQIAKNIAQNCTRRRFFSGKSHAFPSIFFGKSSLSAILRKTNLHLTTILGGSL